MLILLVISIVAGVVVILGSFVVAVKLVVELLSGVQKSTSEVVVSTVTEAMKSIFGGGEPAKQLPGNPNEDEKPELYYPPHEYDELAFPGSAEEIAGMEAGWAASKTDQPSSDG